MWEILEAEEERRKESIVAAKDIETVTSVK
jgi:hypothetical protein